MGAVRKVEAGENNQGLGESSDLRGMGDSLGAYVELTRLIERLHRRYLDVLRTQLDRLRVTDINAVQCLLLCNIGDAEINAKSLLERGYYLGSNASYNVKKLVSSGYLEQRTAAHDRRSTLLRVSARGRDLCRTVIEGHSAFAEAAQPVAVSGADTLLRQLERAWDEFLQGRA